MRKPASVLSAPVNLALSVALLTPHAVFAASSEKEKIADLEKKFAQSLAVIEKLSARIDELEKAQKAQNQSGQKPENAGQLAADLQSNTTLVQQQSERIDQLEKNLVQVSEISAKKRELGLPVHGFSDVGYAYSSKSVDGRQSGFVLGNLDFYLTPDLGDRIKALFELNFEFDELGSGVSTDLERIQIGYTFSDSLTLWAGRVHTPYGYWNTAYHHGAQLQPSILRPKFIAFEDQGGILPSHTVGLMGSGTYRLEGGRLGYDVFIGNGSRIIADGDSGKTILDFNAGKDDNLNKAIGGNIRYSFGPQADGLTVGVHGLSEQVNQQDSGAQTRLTMYGLFAALDNDYWESVFEYYRFRNKDLSGGSGTHTSWATFAHLGYRINDVWLPYIRLEKANLDQTDNYFASLTSGRSYTRQVLGLRYNISPISAVKLEFNHTKEQQTTGVDNTVDEARVQYSIRF